MTSSEALRSVLLVEMAARVLKHVIKRRWREQLAGGAGFSVVSSLKKVETVFC